MVNGLEQPIRIGELSKIASVSRDSIRFYERNGLIKSQPSSSSTNNYRIYPESTIITLSLIREAKSAGFTLSELLLFIRTLENSADPDFDGDKFLEDKIQEVEEKIVKSQNFLNLLKQTKMSLENCP